jgi:hypothetical protein
MPENLPRRCGDSIGGCSMRSRFAQVCFPYPTSQLASARRRAGIRLTKSAFVLRLLNSFAPASSGTRVSSSLGKLRRNPRPRVSFAPLKSLCSVFSFLAAGNSVRGAHSASLASAHQFGIQWYALRAVNTASNVAVRVYFCWSPMFPAPARVHRRICSLKRGYEAPSLCLSVKMYHSLRSLRFGFHFPCARSRNAQTRVRRPALTAQPIGICAWILYKRHCCPNQTCAHVMSASQCRRCQPSYSSSTILLAPRRLPMRSPPPPSVGGALAALVGKPAHCRSYLAQWLPCVANYFFASVGDQWGDRAPPRTPVPPSIGTKTNVVATANHSGYSVCASGECNAQCADRSLTCVSRLRGQAAERTAFGGSVRPLPPAVSFIGFVVVTAHAMFLHVGKCQLALSVPVVGWSGFISAR